MQDVLTEKQSAAFEEWKRRRPDLEVIGVRVAYEDELEIHVTYMPAFAIGRIEVELTFRG